MNKSITGVFNLVFRRRIKLWNFKFFCYFYTMKILAARMESLEDFNRIFNNFFKNLLNFKKNFKVLKIYYQIYQNSSFY